MKFILIISERCSTRVHSIPIAVASSVWLAQSIDVIRVGNKFNAIMTRGPGTKLGKHHTSPSGPYRVYMVQTSYLPYLHDKTSLLLEADAQNDHEIALNCPSCKTRVTHKWAWKP